MICESDGKSGIRQLWNRSIATCITIPTPHSCLWLASDDFRDILPLTKYFSHIDIPERCAKSKARKRKHLHKLPGHVAVLDGSIKDQLLLSSAKYTVINLDLQGQYDEETSDLCISAFNSLAPGGLLFLTVATKSTCSFDRWNRHLRVRLANGPMGVITNLYMRMPFADDVLLFLDGFPKSYYGSGSSLMHSFGWKKLMDL